MHDLVCWGVFAAAAAACGAANWTVNWGVNFVTVVSTATLASDKRPQLLLL
jgi:hypothetical protein